jgi:hypothetical protein
MKYIYLVIGPAIGLLDAVTITLRISGSFKMTKSQEIEYIKAIHNLTVYFGDNYSKIRSFMHFKNLNLGGISPMEMILLGRGDRLNKWIENQLDENKGLKCRA